MTDLQIDLFLKKVEILVSLKSWQHALVLYQIDYFLSGIFQDAERLCLIALNVVLLDGKR